MYVRIDIKVAYIRVYAYTAVSACHKREENLVPFELPTPYQTTAAINAACGARTLFVVCTL
jgi:hypothetical protein